MQCREVVPGFHVPEPHFHQVYGQVVFQVEVVSHFLREYHQHGGISSVGQLKNVTMKIAIKGGGKLSLSVHHRHLHCPVLVQVESVSFRENRVKGGQPLP